MPAPSAFGYQANPGTQQSLLEDNEAPQQTGLLDPYDQRQPLNPYSKAPKADAATSQYPTTTAFAPGISPYDQILFMTLKGWATLPLHESPQAGTKLELDRHKGRGHDWARLISKGYEAVPTRIVLLLFRDMLTGTDFMQVYDYYVRDMLMPTKIDKRNAVTIYNPLLAADGINSFVPEFRSTPRHIGKQMFTVEVTGYDIRFADQGNVTKAPAPKTDSLRHKRTEIDDQVNPVPGTNLQLQSPKILQTQDPASRIHVLPPLTYKGAE